MQSFFIYLLQVTAWFVPLYILYLAVFRRFTFFTANRFYLLLALALPFVLPLVHVSFIEKQIVEALTPGPAADIVPAAAGTVEKLPAAAPGVKAPGSFNPVILITVLYGAGFLWVFVPFITGITNIIRKIRRNEVSAHNGLRLVLTPEESAPASFFKFIFISKKLLQHPQLNLVLAHEQAHARNLHTADLLVAGLAKCLCWFNPLVWLYSRSLREVHEFEADRDAARNHDAAGYARLLLHFAGSGRAAYPLHTFSRRPLTTRINMLLTPKTAFMKRFTYFLLLPVLLLLLVAYGNIRRHTKFVLQPGSDFVLLIDAGHGGTDPGAVITGTDMAEKDINLALALQLQREAEAAGIQVIMTRTADSAVPLKNRTALAAQHNAGLILSLHASAAPDAASGKNGIEFYAGSGNNPAHSKASLEVVNCLGRSLKNLEGITVAPSVMSRENSVWMLKQAPCPSVLIECGYLTHPGDRAFLTSETKRSQMAKALLEGVLVYIQNNKPSRDENGHAAIPQPAKQPVAGFRSGAVQISGVTRAGEKTLALYTGVDNNVTISTDEAGQDILVELEKGTASNTGNGVWQLRSTQLGPCRLKVYGQTNGRRRLLGSFSFMAMPLPQPAWQIPGLDYKSRKNNEGC